MMQPICDDCMLAPVLYQLSLFCIFYEILSDQKTLQSDRYKNIVEFLTKLLRTFFKQMKDLPLLLLEILSGRPAGSVILLVHINCCLR